MDGQYALAYFLKTHRERKGLNPRQFAEAITKLGGKASTQAVQQWENTDPAQRTTRPNAVNRAAISEVLECDPYDLDKAYRTTKEAVSSLEMPAVDEVRFVNRSLTSRIRPRTASGKLHNYDQEMAQAIRSKMPEATAYLDREISPFGLRRRYDYLSPNLAATWVSAVPIPPFFKPSYLESRLWQLLWLSKLDSDTGASRKYVLILIAPGIEAAGMDRINALYRRTLEEIRVFGDQLDIILVNDVELGAQSIYEIERSHFKASHLTA